MIHLLPMNKEKRFTVTFHPQYEGQLLREAIVAFGISRRALTDIKFEGGAILVNGVEQNVRYQLNMTDEITVIFPLEQVSDGLIAQDGALDILYEDDQLLVINKPPYESTIPSREHPKNSLANFIAGYFKRQDVSSTVHIITRLDRDTSGLVCIAKHRHIHHVMSGLQQKGQIKRHYEAIVHGFVESRSIIAPIGRKESSIIEREVRADGQFAHTDVLLIEHFTIDGEPYSHIELDLHTGRTHQIRVHMASIGHPLIGDELYSGKRDLIARQALHCRQVEIEHGADASIYSVGLPQDMMQVLQKKN